ncbi:MAG TPA: hypothetical protein VFO55_03595 [Gemmatimonadaceae bacterium]|nr:hypothetical protein [Gemmatimonadaceae bacterium]
MTDSFSTHNPLARLTSAALALGGIAGAAFIIISRGEIVGALAMLSPRWMIAHNLHFASAALLLFGVVGLYLSHSHAMSLVGHFAFVLALLGTGFYFATGVVTAAILPFIAGTAPTVVSATGPLFNPTLPAIIVAAATFQLGWTILGIVVARAGILPAWTGWATALGAAIGMIPPKPFGSVPWIVTDIGWVVLAIGLVGMGVAGWRQNTGPATP